MLIMQTSQGKKILQLLKKEFIFSSLCTFSRGSKAVDNYTAVQGEVKNIRQYKLDQAVTLGHKSYADMSMVSKMADSVDSVKAMISNLAGKAKQRQEMELEALQNYANTRGQDEDLEVYDVDYWTRKQRRTILGK